MWENTAAIHSVLKKNNYKAKFSRSSILKKIKLTEIIFEKKNTKKQGQKNHAGNTVSIHSVL